MVPYAGELKEDEEEPAMMKVIVMVIVTPNCISPQKPKQARAIIREREDG